jgi:hypothetical protein
MREKSRGWVRWPGEPTGTTPLLRFRAPSRSPPCSLQPAKNENTQTELLTLNSPRLCEWRGAGRLTRRVHVDVHDMHILELL